MPSPYDSTEYKNEEDWRQKSKTKNLQANDCIAVWTDVCGFGSLLESCEWNLFKLNEMGGTRLLNDVYTIAGKPFLVDQDPLPNDKVIVLNDGIARTVDLKHKKNTNPYSFLCYLSHLFITHFFLLNKTEEYGVGVRTILSGGERLQYSLHTKTGASVLYYDENKVSPYGQKLLNTTFVYNPIEFQLNTAFAKAFTIDSLGSKNNIKVNGFYIEESFLEKINGIPDIQISHDKKSIKFFFKENLFFELLILESINLLVKGLNLNIHHIGKALIYKAFDGDDSEVRLYRKFKPGI